MKKYKCLCCGYYTLDSRGNYDICPICYWEDETHFIFNKGDIKGIFSDDDIDEEALLNKTSGANHGLTLGEGRANYETFGACEKEMMPYVREPYVREIIKSSAKFCTVFETERLILRPWTLEDAESLFEYASNPDVGPIAGWPPHKSIEESKDVIKNVLNGEQCYAICLKEDNAAIGCIELKLKGHTDMTDKDDECELGYWIGKPFWGNNYMLEAVDDIVNYGFRELGMSVIWCGYYDGNEKSKRVQEKCGFTFHHTTEDVEVPLMKETRVGHTNILTKEQWLERKNKRV